MNIRVGKEPALAGRGFRLAGQCVTFPLMRWVSEKAFFVSSCSCGSEVPFGRSMRHFSVMALIVGNACCFRFRRVAKRNGGGLVGAVCLVGVFAKETISVDWCIRECTTLGVLGLVGRTRGRVSQAIRPAGNIWGRRG